jgi:hypothetical protein
MHSSLGGAAGTPEQGGERGYQLRVLTFEVRFDPESECLARAIVFDHIE